MANSFDTPNTPRPTVGQCVREARLQRNLSQKKLADLAGLSITLMYRLERGERAPSIRTLRKLETVLECDLLGLVVRECEL